MHKKNKFFASFKTKGFEDNKGLLGDALTWVAVTFGIVLVMFIMIFVISANERIIKSDKNVFQNQGIYDLRAILDSEVNYQGKEISIFELLFRCIDNSIDKGENFKNTDQVFFIFHSSWDKPALQDWGEISGFVSTPQIDECNKLLANSIKSLLDKNYDKYIFKMPQGSIEKGALGSGAEYTRYVINPATNERIGIGGYIKSQWNWASLKVNYRGEEIEIKFIRSPENY